VIDDLRVNLASAIDRASTLPRWRLTSVVLAAVLVAMPIPYGRGRAFGSLSVAEVEVLALLGVLAGWVVLDRLNAVRSPAGWAALASLAIAVGGWVVWSRLGLRQDLATVLAISFVFGGLLRGRESVRSATSLVAIAAVTTWLTFDFWHLPDGPLRDFHLYLEAGKTALAGGSPYLTAPVTSIADRVGLPFVYPPFTIPVFELLASVPGLLSDVFWVGGSILAVVAAFWLLGVRRRWLIVLLAWPSVAQGIAVGNVASFTFFLYALGFRVGAAIVLSGMFKVQSMIPAIWLVAERRWRELIAGIAVIAVIAAISLPVVGLNTWLAWPDGLRHFQESLNRFRVLEGRSTLRLVGPILAIVVSVGAVGFALIRRGRNALARFGLASVRASPTLYLHGLSPLLAGMLILGPELLWFTLGVGPWKLGSYATIAIVGLALLRAVGNDLRTPSDLSRERADLHPAGRFGQIWPEWPPGRPSEDSVASARLSSADSAPAQASLDCRGVGATPRAHRGGGDDLPIRPTSGASLPPRPG
jgi:hypothetical protein